MKLKERKFGFASLGRQREKCAHVVEVANQDFGFGDLIGSRERVSRDRLYHITPTAVLYFVGLAAAEQPIVYYKELQKGVYRVEWAEQKDLAAEANPFFEGRFFCESHKKAAEKGPKPRWRIEPYTTRPHWLRKYAGEEAKDILEFCQHHNILSELKSATELAEKCFWSSDLELKKETDPETGDIQIVIVLSIQGKSGEEVLTAYGDYIRQIIKTIPWPQRSMIRLSYDIL